METRESSRSRIADGMMSLFIAIAVSVTTYLLPAIMQNLSGVPTLYMLETMTQDRILLNDNKQITSNVQSVILTNYDKSDIPNMKILVPIKNTYGNIMLVTDKKSFANYSLDTSGYPLIDVKKLSSNGYLMIISKNYGKEFPYINGDLIELDGKIVVKTINRENIQSQFGWRIVHFVILGIMIFFVAFSVFFLRPRFIKGEGK